MVYNSNRIISAAAFKYSLGLVLSWWDVRCPMNKKELRAFVGGAPHVIPVFRRQGHRDIFEASLSYCIETQ